MKITTRAHLRAGRRVRQYASRRYAGNGILYAAPSPLHGEGAFTDADLPAGTLIRVRKDTPPAFHGFNWSDHPNARPGRAAGASLTVLTRPVRAGEEITLPRYGRDRR